MREKCKIEEQSYCFAIFKMPFMHRLTQSMAENTYYRSRGKNIVKVKIDTNNSRTLKQQQQRAKMRTHADPCGFSRKADGFFGVERFCQPERGARQRDRGFGGDGGL